MCIGGVTHRIVQKARAAAELAKPAKLAECTGGVLAVRSGICGEERGRRDHPQSGGDSCGVQPLIVSAWKGS